MEDAARTRARGRQAWPGGLVAQAEAGEAAVITGGTMQWRIALVEQLTRDAWALSGRPLPEYERSTMPGRIVRGGG